VSSCDRTCQKEHWALHKTEWHKGLREGDYALLISLRSRPELNGECVLLNALDAETGRWEGRIMETSSFAGTRIKVLARNLSKHARTVNNQA
jgi:hypothetical protein